MSDPMKTDWDVFQAWVRTRVNLKNSQVKGIHSNLNAHIGLLGFMGLAGEAGEVLDLGKKYLMHGKPLDKQKLVEEIGDVFWYAALLLEYYDIDFSDVLVANVHKLEERDGKNGEKFNEARGIT